MTFPLIGVQRQFLNREFREWIERYNLDVEWCTSPKLIRSFTANSGGVLAGLTLKLAGCRVLSAETLLIKFPPAWEKSEPSVIRKTPLGRQAATL